MRVLNIDLLQAGSENLSEYNEYSEKRTTLSDVTLTFLRTIRIPEDSTILELHPETTQSCPSKRVSKINIP